MSPLFDNVLVKLDESHKYKHVKVNQGKYDSIQTGVLVSLGDGIKESHDYLLNKHVYWKAYKDQDAVFAKDDGKYSFMNIKELVGYDA
jgi:co-chaperonin GroES (HSP10)